MSENVFDAYISVRIAPEHNNEETMEPLHKDWYQNKTSCPICGDMNGVYGLRYHIGTDDWTGEVTQVEYEEVKVSLRKDADEMGIILDESSWKIQAAFWYNGTDCPLTF